MDIKLLVVFIYQIILLIECSIQVTVSKDDTVILDGAGDKKNLEERAEQVHALSLEHAGTCLIALHLMYEF